LRRLLKTYKGADLSYKKETLHERISRRINKAKQQVKYQAKLYNKQVKARAITRTRVKQEQVIEYQVCTINIKERCYVVVKYKQKPRIYISSCSHVQTSRLLAKTPKIDYLLGAPPH